MMRILTIVITSLLASCTLPAHYYNQEGIVAYTQGDFEVAKQSFADAQRYTNTIETVINHAAATYQQGNYEQALRTLSENSTQCTNKGNNVCAQLFYNLGNTHYRVGEREEDPVQKQAQWQQAVEAYEQVLTRNEDDTQARENMEFVKKKLQELEQAIPTEDESKSEEGNEKEETESEGSEGEKESSDEQTSTANEQKPSQNQQPLDPRVNQQIEQYMQQLDQRAQQRQQFFQQRPEDSKQQHDALDRYLNDPFFQQFFEGTPFEREVGDAQKDERDW